MGNIIFDVNYTSISHWMLPMLNVLKLVLFHDLNDQLLYIYELNNIFAQKEKDILIQWGATDSLGFL